MTTISANNPKFLNSISKRNYSYLVPILPILAMFLIIGVLISFIHYAPTARTETDGGVYMARSVGPVFQVDAFQGIGYPWAIRFFNTMGFNPFTSGRLVSLFSGLILVLCTYLIAYHFHGIRSAVIAGIFVAFNSNTILQSSMVMSDMLAASMYIAAITMLLVPNRPAGWQFLLAGAFSGYAYLTRYVYIFLLILPVVFVILQSDKRKYLFSILIFYIGFFLITSPWMIYLTVEKGNPFYQDNQDNIILKYMEQLGFPDKRGIYSGFFEVIAAYPLTFVESITKSLLQLPGDIFTSSISPVGIIGTIGGVFWISKMDRKRLFFLAPNLIYAGLILLVFMMPRYVLPFAPLVAIFVSASLDMIPEKITVDDLPNILSRVISVIPLRATIIVGLILLMIGFSSWNVLFTYSDKEVAPEYVAASQQFQTQLTHRVRVVGRRPQLITSPDVEFVVSDTFTVEALIKEMEEKNIDYFAIDERYTAKYRPEWAILLNPEKNPYPDKLSLVVQIDTPMKVAIYKLIR